MDAAHAADESAKQIVHDRSLIDHLVATFHSDSPDEPAAAPAEAVYDLIKREWPENLTLGTRF
ncbi:MAG TPA: hypothetical protein VF113_09045 [Stellaceae bacterium]